MASWVIMEKPGDDRAGGDTVFVRDRFSVIAFVIPIFWLLWHRLWIESLIFVAVALGIAVAGTYGGLAMAEPFVSFLLSLFIGLEGPNLRLRALARRGWHDAGVVEAENRDEAEILWFGGAAPVPEQPVNSRLKPAPKPAAAPVPAIGLVEYPGGR